MAPRRRCSALCKCLGLRQEQGEVPVGKALLCFTNPEMESAFLSERRPALCRRVSKLLLLIFSMVFLSLAFNVFVRKSLVRSAFPTEIMFLAYRCQAGCLLAAMMTCLLWLSISSCPRLMEAISTPMMEVVVSIFNLAVLYIVVLGQPVHVAKIWGYTLKEAWGDDAYDSDSGTLLMIIGVVSAIHIAFPLRWFIMVIFEIAAVGLYATTVFVCGSEETPYQVTFNFFFLTGIMIAAVSGKRAAEMDARAGFWSLIEQKLLRCRAEFQLEQVGPGSENPKKASEHGSLQESGAPTAASGHVFDPMFGPDVDAARQLAHIAALGDLEHWRIQESEVKVVPGAVLGAGGFGVVQKAIFCGMSVAMKTPKLAFDDASLQRIPELCNELRILRHLRHPNIVATHGALVLPRQKQIALILELIEGVLLRQFLFQGATGQCNKPSMLQRYQVMIGVCRALLYMHTRIPPIVHGDLKSSNIMIEHFRGTAHAKLLDFGLSRVVTRNSRPLGGSLAWTAPEVFGTNAPIKCTADIYSFGLVLAFVATSIPPRSNLSPRKIKDAFENGKGLPPLTWPEQCAFGPICRPLVDDCLSVVEHNRPSISQIHEKLLDMPEEGVVSDSDAQDGFLRDVRSVAEHAGKASHAADQVRHVQNSEGAGHPEARPNSRLASVPEEPVSLDVANAPQSCHEGGALQMHLATQHTSIGARVAL